MNLEARLSVMTSAPLHDTSTDSQEMLALLRQLQMDSLPLFDHVRPGLDHGQAVGVNAKGDDQKPFDIAADEWIRQWLSEHFESGVVESEERTGVFEFGSGEQGYRFIVDPVDGSDNFARGLPLSAISLAMLPRETSLSTDGVIYASVGDTSGSGAVVAARGSGAYASDGRRLHTSETRRLSDAFVSCDLNHWAPDPSLPTLMRPRAAIPGPGNHERIDPRPMIAACVVVDLRCSSELGIHDDQRLIEQAPFVQLIDQRRQRPIESGAERIFHLCEVSVVRFP